MNGVSKTDGLATMAGAINASDEWIVFDHLEVPDGWVAMVRLGALVIMANNVGIDVDAFASVAAAHEQVQRDTDVSVAVGYLRKTDGTVTVGTADPADVRKARQGMAQFKAAMAQRAAVMAALSNGNLTGAAQMAREAMAGSVVAGTPQAALSVSEDDWRPGMYV